MAEHTRLRLGLIGAGGVTVQHLPALRRLGRTDVVGVASRTLESASRITAGYGGRAYTDTEAMLDAERPDIGLVCLPPHRTGEACQALIDRGIPFLTEKPLAADPETPERIALAIERAGLIVGVGYQGRAVDFLPQVRKRLAGAAPRLVVGRWMGGTPPPVWWRHAAEGGGQVVEQATHLFDLARFLLGEADVVSAVSSHHERPTYPDADVADASAALLRFHNGALGSFVNTCISPASVVELVCYAEGLTTTINLTGAWPDTSWSVTWSQGGTTSSSMTNQRNAYEVQDEAFLDAVEHADPGRLFSSYADALLTDRLTRAVVAVTGAPA